MKNRPKCENPNCTHEALVSFAGHWVCGECATKFNQINNDNIFGKLCEASK
jgi:hypothetical protein